MARSNAAAMASGVDPNVSRSIRQGGLKSFRIRQFRFGRHGQRPPKKGQPSLVLSMLPPLLVAFSFGRGNSAQHSVASFPGGDREMADNYDSLLLRLIGSLESNTPAARQQLYSQAREILSKRLKAQESPESVRAEQAKLDEAIRRVESQQVGKMFESNGKLGSLPSAVKAAIAIPSILLVALLCVGGYFYLSGNFNSHETAPNSRPAPTQKTLDRTAALKILAGTSPVTKSLPLGLQIALLKADNTWWHPPLDQTTQMMQEDEPDFLTDLGAFQKVSFANMVGTIAKPLWSLRAYWGSGVVEKITQSAQPNWIIISLKPQFRSLCLRDQTQGSPAAAPDVPAPCAAIIATRSVTTVTGIVGDDKAAMVEYLVTQQPTDFGGCLRVVYQSLDQYDQVPDLNPGTEQFVAQLLRYDDGWRVQHVERKQ